jgi:hypothetical protein
MEKLFHELLKVSEKFKSYRPITILIDSIIGFILFFLICNIGFFQHSKSYICKDDSNFEAICYYNLQFFSETTIYPVDDCMNIYIPEYKFQINYTNVKSIEIYPKFIYAKNIFIPPYIDINIFKNFLNSIDHKYKNLNVQHHLFIDAYYLNTDKKFFSIYDWLFTKIDINDIKGSNIEFKYKIQVTKKLTDYYYYYYTLAVFLIAITFIVLGRILHYLTPEWIKKKQEKKDIKNNSQETIDTNSISTKNTIDDSFFKLIKLSEFKDFIIFLFFLFLILFVVLLTLYFFNIFLLNEFIYLYNYKYIHNSDINCNLFPHVGKCVYKPVGNSGTTQIIDTICIFANAASLKIMTYFFLFCYIFIILILFLMISFTILYKFILLIYSFLKRKQKKNINHTNNYII